MLVERVTDTRYGENPRADSQFAQALQSGLIVTRKVEKKETLQSITSKVYGIGPKSNARAYAALENKIRELNQLDDASKISANSDIILPDVPPKQYKQPAKGNPYLDQPRISAGAALAEVESGKSFDFVLGASKILRTISDIKRKAAPFGLAVKLGARLTSKKRSQCQAFGATHHGEFCRPRNSGRTKLAKSTRHFPRCRNCEEFCNCECRF